MPAAGAIKVPQIIPLRPPRGYKKHVIDSSTEIDIRLENKECDIYYTLNNKRPDPFQVYGEKYTHKFDYPFTLPPGKVTLKVMAMTCDGSKQSSVVTRTFLIHEKEEKDREYDADASSSAMDLSLSQQFRQRLRLSSRESFTSEFTPSPILPPHPPPSPSILHKRIPMASPVLQDSTTAGLACLHCLTPTHKGHIYCTSCGTQLPDLPVIDVEPTRLSTCPQCQSELSPNTTVCHVCDATIQQPSSLPLLHVQVAKDVMHLIPCLHCGMRNNPQMSICTTCDQPLLKKHEKAPPVPGQARETIMHPVTGSSYVMCGTCGRVNVSDARFCDWCGCKPAACDIQLMCQSCEVSNDWQARYCYKCGDVMKCPLRPEVETGRTLQMPKGAIVDHHKWIPVADIVIQQEDKVVTAMPEAFSVATQTQGLFYPSEKTITVKKQRENWQKLVKKVSQDRLMHLSNYSPGKGLWRAQLEHIVTHFKAHSSSSPEFQGSIANYQLGKLLKSSTEDGPDELTLKLSFAVKSEQENQLTGYQVPTKHVVKKSDSLPSNSTKRKRSNNSSQLTQLKVEDHLLASELAFTGQGRPDIVASLLQKGANTNAADTSGLPVLLLAASNGHLEAMNVLIETGNANLNIQAKKTGHTALHEAVVSGISRKSIIQSLLSHGANPSIKNKDNLTPCELANKLGHKQLTVLFANQLGSSMVGKLLSSQSSH